MEKKRKKDMRTNYYAVGKQTYYIAIFSILLELHFISRAKIIVEVWDFHKMFKKVNSDI